MIFQSRAMLRVVEQARRFARSSVAVLLSGESGTGKELVARQIHQESPRAAESYVRLNCAALSESLMESELFGHEAGAFTGAQQRRLGHFENTGPGTLFLDEIGELSCPMQTKLLRVLEEREFQRVGGNQTLRFDGRIITATNRQLELEIQENRFREDLYHRLNILSLHLPPLRERREDIPPLVQHFIRLSQPEVERAVKGVTRPVMEKLCEYDWPGNVRELKNVMLRCCLLATSDIIDRVDLPDLPELPLVRIPADAPSEELPHLFRDLSLEEIERQVILHRLRLYRGNRTETAAALGVTPRTLRNKMTHYRKLGYVG